MPAKQATSNVRQYVNTTHGRREMDFLLIKKWMKNRPEWPTQSVQSPMTLSFSNTKGCIAFKPGDRSVYATLVADQEYCYYMAHTRAWDSRLYSTVYSKFTERARQGSAEWGMNIVQARKSLSTFVQLATTSAVAVASLVQAHKIGINALRKRPNLTERQLKRERDRAIKRLVVTKLARERRRLQNEIFLLDKISATFLAYRYGVAPLMQDLFETAQILSGEFKDEETLRASRTGPWSGAYSGSSAAKLYRWQGTESVVLKATVSCTNPNLLLANRLGLVNPLTVIHDNIPWSFMVEWWIPIGRFLGSFTALVGLSLKGASITRTRTWEGTWVPISYYSSPASNRFNGKRKERTTGSLPIPATVPYGTGLGIQRGQNALALIVQKLNPR